MIDQARKDHALLRSIQALLSGVRWTPDTLNRIAELLNCNGYTIGDTLQDEEHSNNVM